MTDQQKTTRVRKTPQTRAQEELDRAKRKLALAIKSQQQHEDSLASALARYDRSRRHHEEAIANIRPEVEYLRAQVEHLAQAPALREAAERETLRAESIQANDRLAGAHRTTDAVVDDEPEED